MKKQRWNAERVLFELAKIRAAIPLHAPAPPPKRQRMEARSAEEFELEAIGDALEALANDAQLMVDEARRVATEKALEVYYAAERLARDPANAELVPHVENMRRAYEVQYGHPIPPR